MIDILFSCNAEFSIVNLLIFIVVTIIQSAWNIFRQQTLIYDGIKKNIWVSSSYFGFDVIAKVLLVVDIGTCVAIKVFVVAFCQAVAMFIWKGLVDKRQAKEKQYDLANNPT